jgi:hypothetical protein
MTVCPVVYTFQSCHYFENINHLQSWTFQATMTIDNRWVTFDERMQTTELINSRSHFLDFATIPNSFSEFRIVSTKSSHTDFLSFNICGFEIHEFVTRQWGMK